MDELVITLDVEDAKKLCYLLNCGILHINGDAVKDAFDFETVSIGNELMSQVFKEYCRVNTSKKGKK